ncbi:hypothetical protein [Psychrobacter sp. CAL346-MNA-CIBAN-0220]|uniref:hypothetical protein n=1 Tax=Psychrobacter sp. CAL346-MNA-CIBAN-0220 TaxID=3140457 RepID=UPI003328C322
MKSKQLTFKRLPMLLATGVLSTGLLLSSCSNNDTAETEVNAEDAATVTTTQEADSQTTTVNNNNVNDTEKTAATTDAKAEASDTETVSKTINPTAAADKQPSLLTNPTQIGTAENTVKLALDTLYYGDVEKAATYYKVDMANFSDELKKTQFAFQQTVEAVTITNTKYNSDKTRATVTGELRLKNQKQPAPLTYELQKIEGEWKILG